MKKNGETKDIYFIILYKKKEKEGDKDFVFITNEIKPKNIYTKEIEGEGEGQNKKYLIQKVFKYDKRVKNEEIEIQFEIGKNIYIISFNIEDKLFYYDIELKRGSKLVTNIEKDIIGQNFLDYYKKFELFLEALKLNQEEEAKIDILYEETIKLYSQKKGFYFLISLFTKIYNRKNLCIKLIKEFYEINKDKRNEQNLDRKESLKDFIPIYSNISSEAENLIKNNAYDSIQFYGIILSFLNYYDYENFKKYFIKLYKDKYEVLYGILLIYDTNLINPIVQDIEFFVKLINNTISNQEFDKFENIINFIIDIETFIVSIDKTKNQIVENYKNDFKTIKIKANFILNKREKGEEMDIIISSIESIINFSQEKEILLIYFDSNFWKSILKHYDKPNNYYINICYRLRETFIKYNYLVNILFDDKIENKKEKEIKNDINRYFNRDEFAFILDKNIINFIQVNKELSDTAILKFISKYDPFYKEDKYKGNINIFDCLKYEKIDEEFIGTFRSFKFEIIFNENIEDFLAKMFSKIDNIFKFGIIMDLIDINRISKKKEYIYKLKQKYEDVVKKEMNLLNGDKLYEAIKTIAKFLAILFIHEKRYIFLEQNLELMNRTISLLIYQELMRSYQGKEYQPMKAFIYEKYLKKLYDIENIISLIDILSKEDKIEFLGKLMKKCSFTKDEFFSNYKIPRIVLLCELFERGKIKLLDEKGINIYDKNKSFLDIQDILYYIKRDIEEERISKKVLEKFLNNGKEIVIKRLGLIKMYLVDFNPETIYYKINKKIEDINNHIKELNLIKNSLLIFHREKDKEEIKEITKIIEKLQEDEIRNYTTNRMKDEKLSLLRANCEIVNSLKDFILFKVIYEETLESCQEKRFNEAMNKLNEIKSLIENGCNAKEIYEKNNKIFCKIKNILSDNESMIDLFINKMIEYYKIKEQKDLIHDLTIIFKSKKYEMDIKSIIFFFENFNPNDINWNSKFPKCEILSTIDFEKLKNILEDLKRNKIYDYEEKNEYFKLFRSLYEKKGALNFLLSESNKDIKYLYDRIDPTNQTITIKNIHDYEECLKIFKKFKEFKNNFDLYEYIKKELNDEKISKLFESYTKNFYSIFELILDLIFLK